LFRSKSITFGNTHSEGEVHVFYVMTALYKLRSNSLPALENDLPG